MTWLDDMEAADPAYPDPGTDPWTMPGYLPETAWWRASAAEAALESGHIGHGGPLPDPWPQGRDWHLVRTAEAAARDRGLRATVPQPHGEHTPDWQADAQAWGTGRGIGPDGPEAG